MEGKIVIAAAEGALELIEGLGPLIQQMMKNGEISLEVQQKLDDRIAALRPNGTAFAGLEWRIEPS